MNKCSPEDMSANLENVEFLKREGIDFVPVPVKCSKDKAILLSLMQIKIFEINRMT
jgi:hypothetical protein